MALTVADASVFVPSFVDLGATSHRARERLAREAELHAPQVLDLEVASGLRRAIARGTLRHDEGAIALRALAAMPIIRYPHLPLMERVWAIGRNVTPYDAAYVALAEYLDTTLLTADVRLAGAPGPRCEIELLA